MKRSIIYISLFLALGAPACQETEVAPTVNDGVAPGPVTVSGVTNLSGAAEIYFQLPSDDDVLYVKGQYSTADGQVRESKVSYYNRSLTVSGFGDTREYDVQLYAVDKGGNESAPVSVTVHPEKAPFLLVYDSLKVISDFGGINISYRNEEEDNVAIIVLTDDSLGNFVPVNTHYTNLRRGDFSTRGLPSEETEFGVYIRDRWGNLSDTLLVTLKPLFEILLDRTQMRGVTLPTDAPLGYGGNIFGLFDGNVNGGHYHTGDAARMPQWFTFDMGVTAKLSRLTWFMRPGFFYSLHNPRIVEIWGTNEYDPDGSFDSWTLLTTHEQIKPSGLPVGQLSNADMDAAALGETVTFPLDVPKVRYLRFKTLQNWSNGSYVNFYEIRLWGDPN